MFAVKITGPEYIWQGNDILVKGISVKKNGGDIQSFRDIWVVDINNSNRLRSKDIIMKKTKTKETGMNDFTDIDAVIFDMDGTLLDTIEDIGFAVNTVLKHHGFTEHTMEAYKKMVGQGIEYLLKSALPKNVNHKGVFQDCLAELKTVYLKNLNVKAKVYEGIVDLLNELKHQKIHMGIVTNKPGPMARLCVEQFFIEWDFKMVGAGENFPAKPNPEGTSWLAEAFGVKPERCLFIGDSHIDMETAKNTGMKAVGVLWGFREKKELQDAGADLIISHPGELIERLKQKRRA